MNFGNKVVVVTGGSSGIGAASAKLFASYGASVAIIGRNEQRLIEVAKVCEQYHNKKPLCLLLDLTLDNSCEEVVRKTLQTFGKINILINCAAKVQICSLFDNNMDTFDELIALNLRVPYKMIQLCLPHLMKTKGNIVNVFGAPCRVRPGFLPFAMIRDALARLTTTGGVEMATEGVRMNAVRPGITRTNFLENLNIEPEAMDGVYDLLAKTIPGGVIIEPEEVARLIVFAASDTCPSLNAADLIIDAARNSS